MASGVTPHGAHDKDVPRRKNTAAVRWQSLLSENRTMLAIDRLGPRPTDEVRLPTEPESAARARRVAVSVMRLWGLAPQADIAELLVSELVGNVVRHTGVRTFGLNLGRRRGWVRIEVRDASRSLPCLIDAGQDAESGRGLYLVDQLADRWGVDLRPRGKSVWFELKVAEQSAELSAAPAATAH